MNRYFTPRSPSGLQQILPGNLVRMERGDCDNTPVFTSADLFQAVEDDDGSLIRRIIAGGVPVDSRDDRGRTPFMIAALRGHGSAHRALLEAHADLDATDDDDVPAIRYNQAFGAKTRADISRFEAMVARALMQGIANGGDSGDGNPR